MIRIVGLTIVGISLFVGSEAMADWDVIQPPAPSGYWRDDPHDPVLRHIPSSIGLSDKEENSCSSLRGMLIDSVGQSTYDLCIRVTLREKRLSAEADAMCKSYGLRFGTAAYAQCRAHIVDRRERVPNLPN